MPMLEWVDSSGEEDPPYLSFTLSSVYLPPRSQELCDHPRNGILDLYGERLAPEPFPTPLCSVYVRTYLTGVHFCE